MSKVEQLTNQVFSIGGELDFKHLALEVFQYQYLHNAVYKTYCDLIGRNPETVKTIEMIPFLPVEFFRSHCVVCESKQVEQIFTSSGTTSELPGKHYVTDLKLYERSFMESFNIFYGDPAGYCILALLPSYLERSGSSLVYMAKYLVEKSRHPGSGFYLHDLEALTNQLSELKRNHQKTILLGVTYALLGLAALKQHDFPDLIVMETGGMKGQRREMIREEVHICLKNGFGVGSVHSEYGMTELLSQAYSKGDGIFVPPPWMKILIRDTNDPFSLVLNGKTGGINIIDLANLNSCAFIQVQDLGKCYEDGSFEVLGRFDHSQVRGCNLMVQ